MKKLYAGIILGIFMMSSFLAINLYTGTSFPGFGGSETCNNCHNQPAFAKTVDTSFSLANWDSAKAVFEANAMWTTDYVPVIPTNNRSEPIEFVKVQFLTNSTHFMMMEQISDSTPTDTNTPSSTSDKLGIIFNIDVVNFTVGDFLNYYNSSETNLNLVLDGQMGFPNGHADLWWIDTHTTGVNTTGKAMDYYISSNYITDGTDHQDVSFGLYYGSLGHGIGYQLFMVRPLTTSDPNDVQFTEGDAVQYAVAAWDDSSNEFHYSSFDQMMIVGNEMAGKMTITTSVVETQTKTVTGSSSASAFTAVFVLAGLVMAVPLIAHLRRRKN